MPTLSYCKSVNNCSPNLLLFKVARLHVSSLAVCRPVIIIIWLKRNTYFYFVNSLLTYLQNVDHITITIIKVKIVSRLRRKTCDIFTKNR